MKKLYIIILLLLLSGCNPFAPSLDNNPETISGNISDQSTVDGLFQNFQYAYSLKDTIIYGQLLENSFIFTYRDFDLGYDISWGRNDEMKTTYGLFQNAQKIDLIWNNVVLSTQDSINANFIRSFNLTITFNPTDIIRIDGRVNVTLKKNESNNKWQITNWIDESNL